MTHCRQQRTACSRRLRMRSATRPSRVRNGFTLVEATVVGGLMVFLAFLLAEAWRGLGRPLADSAAEFRLTQEANLAVTSLAQDFGGYLPEASHSVETRSSDHGRVVGRLIVRGTQLWLCFDGGETPDGVADWARPDTVISYYIESGQLVRWNQNTDTLFTVARHANELNVKEGGNEVEIELTFSYRNATRTHTLVARDP